MAKKKEVNKYDWYSISGEKYWQIIDILQSDEDDITKQAELIATIEGISVDEVLNMPIQESAQKVKSLAFLNEFPMKEYRSLKTQVMGGKTYDVIVDMSKLTTAAFIDYQTYTKLSFRDAYDKILSCFIIPAGFTYNDGYDVAEVQKVIRENLSWPEVQGMLGFMLKRYAKSFMRSRQFLIKAIKKEKDQMKREELQSKVKDMDLQLSLLTHQLQRMIGSAS